MKDYLGNDGTDIECSAPWHGYFNNLESVLITEVSIKNEKEYYWCRPIE